MLLRSGSAADFGLLKTGQRLTAETSGAELTVESHIAGGGQGDVYAVSMGDNAYALKWYRPEVVQQDKRLRDRLRSLSRRKPPSRRFLWPIDLVTRADGGDSFGYIMPLREKRFRDFNELMSGAVRPSFRIVITAALEVVQDYQALHSGGLCYMDINFGNVAFDPATGEVRICDNDNAEVNGTPAAVAFGTPKFMAPEVVQRKAAPTRATDLWSLGVLLFNALIRSDPLLGEREVAYDILDARAEDELYGAGACFIFDPDDASNRPVPDYHPHAILLWPIYPQFIRELFIRAFTKGINDPHAGRVREIEWLDALARLRDANFPCPHCGTENFYDAESNQPASCWSPRCRKPLSRPLCIQVGEHLVAADERVVLYPHHLEQRFDFSKQLAECLRHPSRRDLIGLRNATEASLKVQLADGRERVVAVNETVELQRGMKIDFGTVKAEVV